MSWADVLKETNNYRRIERIGEISGASDMKIDKTPSQ